MQSLIRLVLTDMVRFCKCINISSLFEDDSLHEIEAPISNKIYLLLPRILTRVSSFENSQILVDMLSEKHIFSITRKFRVRCQSLLYVVDAIQKFGNCLALTQSTEKRYQKMTIILQAR